jgi:Tfp pilus assembly pilus retraction ATPase PilT
LLRAVYGHGGTGGFVVSQIKKSVLVAHGSLGHSTQYNKSALVACLRDSPDVVYTTVSVAE